MRFKVTSSLNIEATLKGSPNDPLVILLHGGGQTRHAWKGTTEKLASSGFYAVALDLRGHGDSDWSERVITQLRVIGRILYLLSRK